MKKILFAVAALATVSLASCGSGDKATGAADSDTIINIEALQTVTPLDTIGDSIAVAVQNVVGVAETVVPNVE